MPTPKQYDELLEATQNLIRVARGMHPKAGADELETVCVTAVQDELASDQPLDDVTTARLWKEVDAAVEALS